MKTYMRTPWFVIFAVPMLLAGITDYASAAGKTKDTLTIIHQRKSVRNYVPDKPVARKDLEILARAGMAAPSAMDRQPWAFVLIDDRRIMNELAQALPYARMLKDAGGAIVVCGIPARSTFGGMEYWVQDCSAASENILLAAEAMGLGAVWTSAYPDEDRIRSVRNVLGIPEEAMPLNIIVIGYPLGVEKPKDKFDPKNIHWNRW